MSDLSFMERLLDGVEVAMLPLGDVTQYEQPTKYLVKETNYSDQFETPVLTAGKTFVLGYTNEEEGINKASEHPVIIFDDFTTANKWVDFDFKVKSSAMKMITSSDDTKFSLKYIYYWLNTLPSELIEGDHKRQWISSYSKKKIPIPCPDSPKKSLEIQAGIVRILDAFTAHTAELTAELTARKKQYHYYRDKLLSFEEGEVEWKTLDEVCLSISAGGDLPEKYSKGQTKPTEEFPYPIYSNGIHEKSIYGYTNEYRVDAEAVTVSARGTIGWHTIRQPQFTPIVRLIVLIPNKDIVTTKFLNHILGITEIGHSGGSIPQLTVPNVKKIKIPVPYSDSPEKSHAEQARIVAILDKFDILTTSISEGLPREIELRQKQYEYYRDRLLSFPSDKAA